MPTTPIYYEDPYKQELECTVVQVESQGRLVNIELDKTIFYPEGGGQPSDKGEIVGPNGTAKVEYVHAKDGRILHQSLVIGSITPGDKVTAKIKWNNRYRNMRMHSAGHLIHDVLMSIISGISPTKGYHGDKAALEYAGTIDPAIKEELEKKINETVTQNLPIHTWDATYEEIVRECKFVPPSLPKNKQLRLLKIGNFDAMPDGGTQVKSTKEIGQVLIHHIISENGKTVIRYGIGSPSVTL